ncbi:class I SAM-dependent methyltransferase [Methylobacterium tarhaniae]|uniref:class I SAM-dependent methyltransferase n=1 Tax=Methylobacterium tarhaniae TaxID=1187852 RepID=UPI00069CF75A|nr:class I SAM-dependent methyltransferase [Methylobacterium tarhaniae]
MGSTHPDQEADAYAQTAELYEILSEQHWSERRDSILRTLADAAGMTGHVVDIGAGTGRGTALIADHIPHVSVMAIEPSASMRVGLMTRVFANRTMRDRVTVCDRRFQEAELPSRLSAAFAFGSIGFLGRQDRRAFWLRLQRCLDEEGFVFADLMRVGAPQVVDETRVASADVGEQRYEIWLSGRPGAQDTIVWTMRCEILRGSRIVRRFIIEREWHAFGLSQLADEAREANFDMFPIEHSPVPAAIFRRRIKV